MSYALLAKSPLGPVRSPSWPNATAFGCLAVTPFALAYLPALTPSGWLGALALSAESYNCNCNCNCGCSYAVLMNFGLQLRKLLVSPIFLRFYSMPYSLLLVIEVFGLEIVQRGMTSQEQIKICLKGRHSTMLFYWNKFVLNLEHKYLVLLVFHYFQECVRFV